MGRGGGDWGAIVVEQMALKTPPGLVGIHTNMANVVPPDLDKALFLGEPVPADLTGEEKTCRRAAVRVLQAHRLRPAHGRPAADADRPDGFAGRPRRLHDRSRPGQPTSMIARSIDGTPEGLTPDDVLDNITLFWLTNTAISAARLYWENKVPFFAVKGVNDSRRRERLPRRAVPGAEELGREGVSEARALQQAPQGRALRRLGAAEVLLGRDSCRIQDAALCMRQHSRRT